MSEDRSITPHSEYTDNDWVADQVLGALQDLEEPVGSFIRAFPGRGALSGKPDWLENWFVALATRFRDGEGPQLKQIVASAAEAGDLSPLAKEPVEAAARLVSVRPHWFRGFREVREPIRFESDLVVIEGRNSSGKTSISEAIEWVCTGQLSRRTSGEQGHPRELADCIANEFRPDGESTRVELTIAVEEEVVALERVLKKDYSTTAKDSSESSLFIGGALATPDEERKLFSRLFAGVPPILMQHNLRRFVHDDPTSRRQYFEQLLQIDELTALIEKAVIGNKAKEIPNPSGGAGIAALRDLMKEAREAQGAQNSTAAKALARLESSESVAERSQIERCLIGVAKDFFGDEIGGASDLSEYRNRVDEAQRRQRESRLPLLTGLEVARRILVPQASLVREVVDELEDALEAIATAKQSASQIGEAQQQIARATNQLIEADLVDPQAQDDQTCPVCEDGTLTSDRVRKILSWEPLARAVQVAGTRRRDAEQKVQQELRRLKEAVSAAVPALDKKADVDVEEQLESLPQPASDLGRGALSSAAELQQSSEQAAAMVDSVASEVGRADVTPEEIEAAVVKLESALDRFKEILTSHRQDVKALQEAVGAASRDDSQYRLREKWLKATDLMDSIAEDLAWEAAKTKAREALNGLREGLIELRTEIVEAARKAFSEEMTNIWGLLRSDSGAAFSQLHVPPARGKGYKLEFGLKAMISDGRTESEVDALRVFSESQVNVVGIAAYVTRANRLGHKLLILDDPVQSMDEEHFRSFAANLLPALIDEGHQVVILTHSNAFGACIHEHHFKSESYATMSTRLSKGKGCWVEEGNRRVSERLKRAEKAAEEGELGRAWRMIRLAIERMYLLVKVRSDATFRSESWRNHTAESMWNEGVGEIIEEAAPGKSRRLKEILASTAAGAHDKPATSETEVKTAIKDLRSLLDPLHLGAG